MDTHLSRLAPDTWMDLMKHFFIQKPSFVSDLMPVKMPHVCTIHVKIFFNKSKKSHFWKLRTVINSLFSETRTLNDKNYGYTFLALSVSIIIIILRSSIRKYYQIGRNHDLPKWKRKRKVERTFSLSRKFTPRSKKVIYLGLIPHVYLFEQ